MLGISQVELSKLANVAIASIKRIEAAAEVSGSARTMWKIQTALESAGIEFIPADDGKGPGVRLKKPANRGRAKGRR